MTFGEKIKSARLSKGLTQKALAELLGVKHNSVSDWESGKHEPDIDTFERLCWELDITPTYLMGKKSDEEYGDIVGKLMNNSDILDMIEEFESLDSEDKKAVRQIISSLHKKSRG